MYGNVINWLYFYLTKSIVRDTSHVWEDGDGLLKFWVTDWMGAMSWDCRREIAGAMDLLLTHRRYIIMVKF